MIMQQSLMIKKKRLQIMDINLIDVDFKNLYY